MNAPSPRARRPLWRSLLVLAALLCTVATARAQGEAHAELFARRDGNDVRAAIRVEITSGWHLYHTELGPPDAVGKATTWRFEGDGFAWSALRFPEPLRLEQPGLGAKGGDTWIWGHEGTLVLYARGSATSAAKFEDVELTLKGLTCEDAGSCIPYQEVLEVAGKGDDALFASFPSDLVAPPAPSEVSTAPASSAPSAKRRESSTLPTNPFAKGPGAARPSAAGAGGDQRASAKLFVRASDGDVKTAIEVAIDPGYHLYHEELGQPDSVGKPTVVTLSGDGFEWSPTRFPTPEKLAQPGIGDGGRDTWIWGHAGKIVLFTRGRAEASAELEELGATIKGLTCTDGGECVPYFEELESSGAGSDELFAAFPSELVVPAGGVKPATRTAAVIGDDGSGIDWATVEYRDYAPRGNFAAGATNEETERGLALWLVLAFIAGALLNVMPCVLPVVSIKVLSFVQQAGESRSRVFALGLAFAAGILVVFVALASLAAFAGQGWGQQFQNEQFKIVMIAIVFGFALSLFDVYELGVPSKVGEIAAIKREGLADAFFKGIMATLLATPCSGPFLGSTLAWALAQEPLVVFAIFTSVGVGMAAPYVLLTSNPALLKFLPRPGAWMKTFKHLMGFLLMATAVYLMLSVRQELVVYTVALLVFVALGCWWWGNFATFDQSSAKKFGTFVVASAIVAGGAWFSFQTLRGWLAEDEFWEPFDPVKLEQYHAEGRNVFIDFTANWCPNCKTNEALVYTNEEIKQQLEAKDFAVVKADETFEGPRTDAITRLREKLGAQSIPFMAIFPGDDPSRPMTLRDIVTRGEMRALIEACPTPTAD
ncbi:MAG: thioredoxin family protein [Planctomycetes bacterium]|nr:thioredoxin family protein [Planctomycetota bacterium]